MPSPSADYPPLAPAQRVSGRGFAVGVALAAVATIVLRRYVVPIEHDFTLDTPAMAVGCAIAAPAGLAGGWVTWREFAGNPPLSLAAAIWVAIVSSLLSLLIACVIGGLIAAASAMIETGKLKDAFIAVMGGIFVMPLFVIVLFGPIFAGLVTAWAVAWRMRVNR